MFSGFDLSFTYCRQNLPKIFYTIFFFSLIFISPSSSEETGIEMKTFPLSSSINLNSDEKLDNFSKNDARRPIKLLSLQGGGIRAIMELAFLTALEELTQTPICQMFDGVIGTSAGALIAAGLTQPYYHVNYDENLHYKPLYTARKVGQLFEENASKIFKSSGTLQSLFGPKYDISSLHRTTEIFFGRRTFSQSIIPTMITTYDLDNQTPKIFKSWEEQDNFYISDLTTSSAAAPVFFAPHTVRYVNDKKLKKERHFVDGGVFANNPSLSITYEAKKLFPNAQKYKIVFVGTGQCGFPFSYQQAEKANLLEWIPEIHTMMDLGQDQFTKYLISQEPKVTYCEWNPPLTASQKKLDVYDLKFLKTLKDATYKMIKDRQEEFHNLAKELIA